LLAGQAPVLVIGIGNAYRCDDAAGLAVARRLQTEHPEGVQILEHSGEGGSLLELWQGAAAVILVDAIHANAPPGTILRFDAGAAPLPADFFNLSTHAFGPAAAIELARTLGILPRLTIVYGIEGATFQAGMELSPAVARSVEETATRVLHELSQNIP
jgi:hydrogenase maturation protease